MIDKLIRHNLDFNAAHEFYMKKLKIVDFLAVELLNSLDFSKGSYYTLLPLKGNVSCIYNFKEGGILDQEPVQTSPTGGKYQLISSIKNELPLYLNNLMQLNSHAFWVFDDVLGAYSKEAKEFYDSYGISALNERNDLEVCYILNKSTADLEVMKRCVEICRGSIWFFLGVMTTAKLSNISDHQMTPERINKIVHGTKMLVVNAYDGEGFVFWEKNNE